MADDPEDLGNSDEVGHFIDLGISVEIALRLALLVTVLIATVAWWSRK